MDSSAAILLKKKKKKNLNLVTVDNKENIFLIGLFF